MFRRFLASLMRVPVAGRNEPRVDGSSDAAARASMDKMAEGLDDAEKKAFYSDCAVLGMGDMMKSAFGAIRRGQEPPKDLSPLRLLDGMTRAEIHAGAEARRADSNAKMPWLQ